MVLGSESACCLHSLNILEGIVLIVSAKRSQEERNQGTEHPRQSEHEEVVSSWACAPSQPWVGWALCECVMCVEGKVCYVSGKAVGRYVLPWHSYGELGDWGSHSSVSGLKGMPGTHGEKALHEPFLLVCLLLFMVPGVEQKSSSCTLPLSHTPGHHSFL